MFESLEGLFCWNTKLASLFLEVVEDLLDFLASDHTCCLLLILSDLLLQVDIEQTKLINLRLLCELFSRIVQTNDELEEVVEKVAVVLDHSILVSSRLCKSVNIKALINCVHCR